MKHPLFLLIGQIDLGGPTASVYRRAVALSLTDMERFLSNDKLDTPAVIAINVRSTQQRFAFSLFLYLPVQKWVQWLGSESIMALTGLHKLQFFCVCSSTKYFITRSSNTKYFLVAARTLT